MTTYPVADLTPRGYLAVMRAADTVAEVTGLSLPCASGIVLVTLAGNPLRLPGGNTLYTGEDLARVGQAVEAAREEVTT